MGWGNPEPYSDLKRRAHRQRQLEDENRALAARLTAVEDLLNEANTRQNTGTFFDGEPMPVIVMAVDVWHALGKPAPNGEAVMSTASLAACAACDGSCGTCPYLDTPK